MFNILTFIIKRESLKISLLKAILGIDNSLNNSLIIKDK
jgi:hypothetical protein